MTTSTIHAATSAVSHASAKPTLRRGSSGESVVDLQMRLAAAGFDPAGVDGDFGPKTEAAVLAFQRAQALAVDGIVGPQTWARLAEVAARPSPAAQPAPVLRRGAMGDAVRALQQRLNALGFDVGSADGDFGPKTEAGVRAFQDSRGLVVDGIVGPQTWIALGVHPEPVSPGAAITVEKLRQIMPNLSSSRASECLPHLERAMAEAAIDNRMRKAAFLAQLAHESAELRYFEELMDGSEYENRRDLGNTHPGDGRRYKGRGPIQLTGRANYRSAGLALGIDLEGNPQRAADLDVGFRVAAWFWMSHNLNALADAGEFNLITRKINGALNGIESRRKYYHRALAVL